jgi:methionine-rich copper-binding protein CopC
MVTWIRRAIPLVMAGAIIVPGAAMHMHLKSSFPARDQVLAGPPTKVLLTFSERPELAFSDVKLLASDSSAVATSKVARCAADSLSLGVEIKAPLADGAYSVVWRSASKDGHLLRGSYGFRVSRSAEK